MSSKEEQNRLCEQGNCRIAHLLISPGSRIVIPLCKVAAKLKIKFTAPQVLWTAGLST